jgi:DNA-binding CsgD family transcriptional regulator
VTPQTDIYSLGVTLYELLTGQHPFPGLTGVERLFKHINEPLPLIESLEPLLKESVNGVIQRATMKNPRHRFDDVLEMAAAFRQAARLEEQGRTALLEALTLREQEILQLIVQGKANREIAESLFVELSTVKWYIRQIYTKLGVHNRRQAILRARELDLLVTDDEEVADNEGTMPSNRMVCPRPLTHTRGYGRLPPPTPATTLAARRHPATARPSRQDGRIQPFSGHRRPQRQRQIQPDARRTRTGFGARRSLRFGTLVYRPNDARRPAAG